MTRARVGALLLTGVIAAAGSTASAQQRDERSALVVLVPGASFEDLMAIPDVASLARAGGAGLLVNPDEVVGFDDPGLGETRSVLDPESSLIALVERHRPAGFRDNELMVIVIGADVEGSATPAVDDTTLGSDIGGIVVARGAPDELFPDSSEQGSLTSKSTRRDGVVTGADVRPTLTGYLSEVPLITREGLGEPIEIIEGPPPFELHERYLAQRQMYVPVGTAAAMYLAIAGLGAIAILALGDRVPSRIRRIFGWAGFSVPMLAVGMLAVGHLPELSYATAVPMIAIVTVFGTVAFAPLEQRDVALVPVGIGVAVLAYFAVEALLGWAGMLTPLLGGSQLDGGRFFGLPNVAIGLLVGSGLWVAHRLRTLHGFVLLFALGLFAGLPYVGSNLGGGVTLFAASGLWLAVRERERLGVLNGVAAFLGVTLLGLAVILLAHAISPLETHVTRFEEDVNGLGGVVERFVDRLQVGFDLIARNPFALIPVLGLPVAIAAVLWPPAPLRPSLERSPAWRDAILVTLLAGVVAYVTNDSGPAAAGFAFGMGLGGLLGVSLLLGAEKMVSR